MPSWSIFAGPITFLYHVMAKQSEANVDELYKMNYYYYCIISMCNINVVTVVISQSL